LGTSGSVMSWDGTSKVVALAVSVKNRWVGSCEQVLNVLIACWWYRPSKLSSLPSTWAWLKRTASVVVLGEKQRWAPQATQSGWEVESGAVFHEGSASVQPCWRPMKCCYTRTTLDTYGQGRYADRAWKVCGVLFRFPLHDVHCFESPWLSDMSNCLLAAVSM
jgi:hypothetical protein